MDGVFMKKILKKLALVSLVVVLVWCGTLLADRNMLRNELIRLHVVANSDDAVLLDSQAVHSAV